MNDNSIESGNRQIKVVTYAGIVTNIGLAAVKMLVGLAAGSIALVADSVHSLSDMVTDVAIDKEKGKIALLNYKYVWVFDIPKDSNLLDFVS